MYVQTLSQLRSYYDLIHLYNLLHDDGRQSILQ
jgi:hypothetical protein